jgi:hypothetical protein
MLPDSGFSRFLLLLFLFFCIAQTATAQMQRIEGKALDQKEAPIEGVLLELLPGNRKTYTNTSGNFLFENLNSLSYQIKVRHISYRDTLIDISNTDDPENIKIILKEKDVILQGVEVAGQQIESAPSVSRIEIDPLSAQNLPSAFGDFNRVLASLPGVSSVNELSSNYAVRGGNYDENLIYVDNIPIYRPYLIRAGRQEGLSFINPDLVKSVSFYSGGWPGKYGDKLSSVLNAQYKQPQKFQGSAAIGLLNASMHLEGYDEKNNHSFLIGARYKSSRYLLNTLETEGQYLPRFYDVQAKTTFDLNQENRNNTMLDLLFYYAQNQYEVIPENRETTFGTFNTPLRLFIGFDGKENLAYRNAQMAARLRHNFSKKWQASLILSGYSSKESENVELEGGYRLCTLDRDPSSSTFDECLIVRGIGTLYHSARNRLYAYIVDIEQRNEIKISETDIISAGAGFSWKVFDDYLNEFEFTDSADFVTVTTQVNSQNSIQNGTVFAYIQHEKHFSEGLDINYGLRWLYFDQNGQNLFSPRFIMNWHPRNQRAITWRLASGLYHQPPFYRELRGFDGQLNLDLKAQSSWHTIVGIDHRFEWWGRPFALSAEAYYKKMWNVVPYDIDNIRIRYYATNRAEAYAAGADFRLSGEFIPGTESWFSLGILKTEEDLQFDQRGYVPRPSDQRINLGVFFQDHFPTDPTVMVRLSVLYSSALPFSPPNNLEFRNSFRGDPYQRVDIGFSKIFFFNKSFFRSLWVGLDILNLMASENPISFTWIEDVTGTSFAVPNALSARFLNIRIRTEF